MGWIQRQVDGILQNLIAQAVIGVLAGVGCLVWAIIREAPDYLVALVVIGGVVGVFGLLRLFIWIRDKVRKPAVPDYWRCPDGKLHEWTYWRGENTGVYMCKNCRSQVDKATLKAHTDQGPSTIGIDADESLIIAPRAKIINQDIGIKSKKSIIDIPNSEIRDERQREDR
ncbi:MAG: hypothetical protein ABID84_05170 [Chloroflexota bacterium]